MLLIKYYKRILINSNDLKLNSVVIDENYTKLNITCTNIDYAGGWFSINNNSYLIDLNTDKKYKVDMPISKAVYHILYEKTAIFQIEGSLFILTRF